MFSLDVRKLGYLIATEPILLHSFHFIVHYHAMR